ncbi:TetR family transcriptional regulator C-terminal domain-containing protein [Aestuariibius sp. HNIBRBA575]|uniref:TetR family transcriptional regulator C-terminal domain-containing protein n=1 Tax=Aestuariibius sp. HNIBRBA575 TaxID=3233343 RepID=UPI0034A52603
MTATPKSGPNAGNQTRIQKKNRSLILEAALDVFSKFGFRGATLDQIADQAGLSKPNLLYYFPSKEAIHMELLQGLLGTWLDPLQDMSADGEPRDEILGYMRRKLAMSRDYPRESRLFANEILQGAPRIHSALEGELRDLVEEKGAVIRTWIADGKMHDVNPTHLLFSIWALTQHYADFEVQVGAILDGADPYPQAETFLDQLFGGFFPAK